MDHGDHAGHGDMDMGDMCNMNVSRAFSRIHTSCPLYLLALPAVAPSSYVVSSISGSSSSSSSSSSEPAS